MSWINDVVNVFVRSNRFKTTKDGIPMSMQFEEREGYAYKKSYFGDSTNYVELQENEFVVNNVITKISKLLSNAQFSDGDSDRSALVKKIDNPNEKQSKEEFLKEFGIYLLSSGYTMIWKKYVSFGNFDTMQLININPDPCVTQVKKNSIITTIDDKEETIQNRDLIFFYDIRKEHDGNKGISRLKPLKMQIVNIRDAEFAKNIQICKSGTTLVSPKASNTQNGMDEGLNVPHTMPADVNGNRPPTQREDLENKLNTRGVANRIIVANKGIDSTNLGSDLAKMDYFKIVEPDILAIYDAYNFPQELSPYGMNAKYNNREAAESQLIESEIYPLAKSLTDSLKAEFPNKGELIVSFDHLTSVAKTNNLVYDTNKVIVDQYATMVSSGIITAEDANIKLTELGVL
jgi:hypothetical protein